MTEEKHYLRFCTYLGTWNKIWYSKKLQEVSAGEGVQEPHGKSRHRTLPGCPLTFTVCPGMITLALKLIDIHF